MKLSRPFLVGRIFFAQPAKPNQLCNETIRKPTDAAQPLKIRLLSQQTLAISSRTYKNSIHRNSLTLMQSVIREFSSCTAVSDAGSIGTLEDLESLLNSPTGRYENPEEFENALRLEYEFFKYNGQQVPSDLSKEVWEEIKRKKSVEDRIDLYRYLFLKERYRMKKMAKSAKGIFAEKKRMERAMEKYGEVPDSLYTEDGLSILGPGPGILRRVDPSVVKHYQRHHFYWGLNYGQPIVFDLGVNYEMTNYESSCFIAQMKELYGYNRTHWEPFNLYLCNYNHRNFGQRKLVEGYGLEDFLWNVTPKCFTQVFPKKDIVYLTRQSRNKLVSFDHDAVYVIGACVDSRYGRNDMSKIKELGVGHAYFDLERYFQKQMNPTLPLNTVMAALLDVRDSQNWVHSMRHFPRRKLRYRNPWTEMNRVKLPDEKCFVNRRSIFGPKDHDISQYELSSETTAVDAARVYRSNRNYDPDLAFKDLDEDDDNSSIDSDDHWMDNGASPRSGHVSDNFFDHESSRTPSHDHRFNDKTLDMVDSSRYRRFDGGSNEPRKYSKTRRSPGKPKYSW